jgi:hypothetical protein
MRGGRDAGLLEPGTAQVPDNGAHQKRGRNCSTQPAEEPSIRSRPSMAGRSAMLGQERRPYDIVERTQMVDRHGRARFPLLGCGPVHIDLRIREFHLAAF